MKKANLNKIFVDEFKYYWSKQKPGGRADLKNDPGFVLRVADDYYRIASPYLSPSEVKPFFEWLSKEEPYFVQENLFEKRLREWCSSRTERQKTANLPDEFARFVDLYGCLADTIHVRERPNDPDCPYHKIDVICANLPARWEYRQQFVELPEKACFEKFYNWLRSVGVKEEYLDRMQQEIQKAEDDLARARASGNVITYYLKKMPPPIAGLIIKAMGYESKTE